MFEVLIVKPLFNLLVFIYALLPGHNFGLSIIIFTVLIRFLMWPLIKKQLHHTKAMRSLQPEIKRIKQATKGDRQKESMMIMELYKERGISPFGSIGILVVQLIILLGLYSGLRRVVDNPQAILDLSYGWLRELSWMKELGSDIGRFDATLFGVVDLTKAALPKGGGIYWPAMLLVFGSAVSQYFQSAQIMPDDKEARGLRRILREASSGTQADQSEVNAAVGRMTRYLIPVMIFVFTVNVPSALGLYWFISGVTAYLQQARILGQDETEMENMADKSSKTAVIEGEVIEKKKKTTKKKKASTTKKKRR
ncbi:MAG TPA: YidC/Oxa1 family membrane protein insertase [Verrucomicrobiae bacterium]|nr:YidC/Oxa1 family membrane protein insertase [Verrucomicrobiae bacterium]